MRTDECLFPLLRGGINKCAKVWHSGGTEAVKSKVKVEENFFGKKHTCAMDIFETRILTELEHKKKDFVSKIKIKMLTVLVDWKGNASIQLMPLFFPS